VKTELGYLIAQDVIRPSNKIRTSNKSTMILIRVIHSLPGSRKERGIQIDMQYLKH